MTYNDPSTFLTVVTLYLNNDISLWNLESYNI